MSASDMQPEVSELVKNLIPAQEIETVIQAFRDLDHDHDGKIDVNEYLDFFMAAEEKKLLHKFSYLDSDEDGFINFEEFLAASAPHYRILKKFKEFDTDGNGLLSLQEAIDIAESLVIPVNPAQIEVVFAEIDRDQDGQVTYYEYLGAITRFGFQ